MSFRDHFSMKAGDYARFRPTYPAALYDYVAGLVGERRLALDCATGNGQAAVELAKRFDRVVATDGSPEQVERAARHDRVQYAVAYAEAAPVREHSVDLVTTAAGLHWFDHDRFYDDVRRVLRPGGVIAAWSYYTYESEPAIDALVNGLADGTLKDYWPEQMHLNQNRFRDIPFPFERIDAPAFAMEADWTLEQNLGFVTTWSASQRYEATHGTHPLELILDDLRAAWGDPGRTVRMRWPLHILVGRADS